MLVTQILYMRVDEDRLDTISDPESPTSKLWNEELDLIQKSPGYENHVWCRGYEEPDILRLHIVRPTLQEHQAFTGSEQGKQFHELLLELKKPGTEIEVRHAQLEDLNNRSAFDAPITGTAFYLNTNEVFTTLVWPLWTHVVAPKRGLLGTTTGKVLDHRSGKECFLVYVGWESLEAHREYWEGDDIRNKDGILEMGNDGRTEFYHVIFQRK